MRFSPSLFYWTSPKSQLELPINRCMGETVEMGPRQGPMRVHPHQVRSQHAEEVDVDVDVDVD